MGCFSFCFLPFIPATVLFGFFPGKQPAWAPQAPPLSSRQVFWSCCSAFPCPPPLPCLAPTQFYFPPGSVGFPWFLLAVAQTWCDKSGTATLSLPHRLGSEQVHPGRGRYGAGCRPPRGQSKEPMSSWVPGAPCPTPSPLLTRPHLLPTAPGSRSSSQNVDYRKETSLRFQACPQELV